MLATEEPDMWVLLPSAPCGVFCWKDIVGVMSFLRWFDFCDCDLFFDDPLGESKVKGVRQTHTPRWRHPGHGSPCGAVTVLFRRNSHTFIRSSGCRSSLHWYSFPETSQIDGMSHFSCVVLWLLRRYCSMHNDKCAHFKGMRKEVGGY